MATFPSGGTSQFQSQKSVDDYKKVLPALYRLVSRDRLSVPWARVPFFIRTGKHLPVTVTEARVTFKRPPRPALASYAEDA